MSAEVLRRAASVARELADTAEAQPAIKADVRGVWLNSRFYMVTTPARERAVADWLEDEAFMADNGRIMAGAALDVARAYLGEDA